MASTEKNEKKPTDSADSASENTSEPVDIEKVMACLDSDHPESVFDLFPHDKMPLVYYNSEDPHGLPLILGVAKYINEEGLTGLKPNALPTLFKDARVRAGVSSRDSNRETSLRWAINSKAPMLVLYLLNNGAGNEVDQAFVEDYIRECADDEFPEAVRTIFGLLATRLDLTALQAIRQELLEDDESMTDEDNPSLIFLPVLNTAITAKSQQTVGNSMNAGATAGAGSSSLNLANAATNEGFFSGNASTLSSSVSSQTFSGADADTDASFSSDGDSASL